MVYTGILTLKSSTLILQETASLYKIAGHEGEVDSLTFLELDLDIEYSGLV